MKLLFYIFLLSISYSQTTGKISGTVLEKDKSAPLPGANIYLVNTAYGAASDADGRFTIINKSRLKKIIN